jgi:hypothetical protein
MDAVPRLGGVYHAIWDWPIECMVDEDEYIAADAEYDSDAVLQLQLSPSQGTMVDG